MATPVSMTIYIPTEHMLSWLRITMAQFLISECRLADLVGKAWDQIENILLNGSQSFTDWVMNGYGICDYDDLDKIFCFDGLSEEVYFDYEDLIRLEGSLAGQAAFDLWDFCIKDAANAGEIKANLVIFMDNNYEEEYTGLV